MADSVPDPALVSVIVPVYNYGAYIARALESLFRQSHRNLEIIVVDDGSTDDTPQILARYGDRIRWVRQENRGAAAARNRGIGMARGEYIAFLDADDAYRPDNIARKLRFLREHPRYRWCYSDWAWVDAQGVPRRFGHEPERSLARLKAEGDVLPLALQGYRLGTNLFLFAREVIEEVGGFDESLTVLEDYDLYVRAAARYPLGYVDRVLVEVHEHAGSLCTGTDPAIAWRCRRRMHRKFVRLFGSVLQREDVRPAWRRQQADLYRHLAEAELIRRHGRRARTLACASLRYRWWQPGLLRIAHRLLWG
ncbi:MAG: glycosyltransferase [Zetaproteobacteria bacterium]|nr:MAG: glycosyltransferase [Zetaproteobacteria bacterium]